MLLDLNVDEADGLELIPRLREIGGKVLVVTACTDESPVAAALALGASGWLNKAQPFERLLDAAESVMRNRPLFGNARFSHNFAISWSFPLAAGNPYQGAGGTVLLQSTYGDWCQWDWCQWDWWQWDAGGQHGAERRPAGGQHPDDRCRAPRDAGQAAAGGRLPAGLGRGAALPQRSAHPSLPAVHRLQLTKRRPGGGLSPPAI